MAQGITTYNAGAVKDSARLSALLNPRDAVTKFDDFFSKVTATNLMWTVTAGTVTTAAVESGVMTIATSTADAHVYSINPVVKATAGRTITFECYCKVSSIGTTGSAFVGLSDTSGTLPVVAATGVFNGTQKGIGFVFTTSTVKGITGDGATIPTAITGATTVADTYVRIGFVVQGTTSCKFYVNGVYVGEQTTGIPADVALYETYGTKYATADKTLSLDWTELSFTPR